MNCKVMVINISLSKKFLIKIGIWTIFFIALLLINIFWLSRNFYLFIFIFAGLSAPFIFSNRIIERKYSKKIVIRLDYDLWSFFVTKNGAEEKYKLSDIKSYWIAESSNGYSSGLSFKLNNHKRIYFSIYNKKRSEDQTDTGEVLESFQAMINNYNKIVDVNQQIVLTSTFAESVYGLISIYVLAGLIIIAVVLHIIYHQIGTLFLSLLVGGGVLMRIIATRQADIKRREKIKI